MQIRADVAELLRAGLSNRAIARELHVDAKDVAAARDVLGLPKAKSGKRAAGSPEDLFWRRVQPTEDGHMVWTGYRGKTGVPGLRHGGRFYTANRLAFRIANGRDPEGKALPSCGRSDCTAPAHQADREGRAEARKVDALYAGIFGASA